MRPLIGVTTEPIAELHNPWSPLAYAQNHTYSDSIAAAGGIPFFIAITTDRDMLRALYERLDGIVFAGGNDIDPALYGEDAHAETVYVSKQRDEQEIQLMHWALEDNLPMLGICRGMQLLNILQGGTLYQDIPHDLKDADAHMVSRSTNNFREVAHRLHVRDNTMLHDIIRSATIAANSYHHQAIKEVGKGLTVSAKAEDGIIEAIELPEANFALGVQCHPEGFESTEPKWKLVFKSLIYNCSSSQTRTSLEALYGV